MTTTTNSEEFDKAVFAERGYEFLAEYKRWFDLVRMHDAAKKPLAFSVAVAYPEPGEEAAAVLSNTEEYKLLWPINIGVMTADPEIKQTWGYNKAENIEY